MKRFIVRIAGSSLLMFSLVTYCAAQGNKTFTGEITDEHLNCSQTPMKAPDGITQKYACILYWAHFVTPGSKYVLYDAATKTTYQLDDQDKVQPYVGAKVLITGTENNKTIKVNEIKVDESAYKSKMGS
jgi:hypothetical protein